jgi:hypothetical protein
MLNSNMTTVKGMIQRRMHPMLGASVVGNPLERC